MPPYWLRVNLYSESAFFLEFLENPILGRLAAFFVKIFHKVGGKLPLCGHRKILRRQIRLLEDF